MLLSSSLLKKTAFTFLLPFFLINCFYAHGQKLKGIMGITLDKTLNEISGLLILDSTGYAINDSGGDACLYRFSLRTGMVQNRYDIKGANNIDFEALTHSKTHVFVGDVGNNFAARSAFQVYKISKNEIDPRQKEVSSEKIEFTLPNYQASFRKTHNFDMEAMHANPAGDSLYIYSKNRESSDVSVYGISVDLQEKNTPQVAKLLGQFKLKELITAAYVDNENLYLLAYTRTKTVLYKINTYRNRLPNMWNPLKYDVPGAGFQRESLVVKNDKVFIASEKTKFQPQSLHQFGLNN